MKRKLLPIRPVLILQILILPALLLSCSGRSLKSVDQIQRQQYNKGTQRISISSLIDQSLESEKRILISVNQKSREALGLMKFIIPILHNRDKLNISFWFLDGNSDTAIMSFLRDEEDAPSAVELLFNADPRITGYLEYEEFLLGMKDFYQSLNEPETMVVGNAADAYVRFSLYDPSAKINGRDHYLVHSPLLIENNKWEIPFNGQLYFMMIHDWTLNQYAAIPVKGSILEDMFVSKFDASTGQTTVSYIDALILMGYPQSYLPFTPIETFINEENISEAVKFYPGQLIKEKTKPAAYLVNSKVERKHRKLSRSLDKQYLKILELEPYAKE